MVVEIVQDTCTGCGECLPFCTVAAISLGEGAAKVDADLCVECRLCVRFSVCPTGSIRVTEIEEHDPRSVRRISDPTMVKATGLPGRGTEEVKTNDVTGRVGPGQVGFCVELGRPGVSASLADLEKVTTALSRLGVKFQRDNPMMTLLSDPERGLVRDEVKGERVLSTLVEFVTSVDMIEPVLGALKKAAGEVDTVFSVGLITRVDGDGRIPVAGTLEELGIPVRPNSKVNLGLGRPLFEEREV